MSIESELYDRHGGKAIPLFKWDAGKRDFLRVPNRSIYPDGATRLDVTRPDGTRRPVVIDPPTDPLGKYRAVRQYQEARSLYANLGFEGVKINDYRDQHDFVKQHGGRKVGVRAADGSPVAKWWLADGSSISGQTSQTFTLPPADLYSRLLAIREYWKAVIAEAETDERDLSVASLHRGERPFRWPTDGRYGSAYAPTGPQALAVITAAKELAQLCLGEVERELSETQEGAAIQRRANNLLNQRTDALVSVTMG